MRMGSGFFFMDTSDCRWDQAQLFLMRVDSQVRTLAPEWNLTHPPIQPLHHTYYLYLL